MRGAVKRSPRLDPTTLGATRMRHVAAQPVMLRLRGVASAVSLLLLIGCANDVEDTPGRDRGIDHGYQPPAACTPGEVCYGSYVCAELVPGGISSCPYSGGWWPVTSCDSSLSGPQCCSASDCPEGQCAIQQGYSGICGRGGASGLSLCRRDFCTTDSDCSDGFCSLGPPRQCVRAACKYDDDCTAEPGGACRMVAPDCCGKQGLDAVAACVYPGDGCTKDEDCGEGYCTVVAGRAACRTECTVSSLS